jgi:hypothetical protein
MVVYNLIFRFVMFLLGNYTLDTKVRTTACLYTPKQIDCDISRLQYPHFFINLGRRMFLPTP